MSYQSVATATPGLVAGWMLADASGTTLADFGPNTLPLTLQARGTLGGTAVIPESARSLTSVSTAGAATANRAVTAGTPLQLATAFTYCGWITMGTPNSLGWLGGRNNNWQLRQNGSSGIISTVVWVGGVAKTVIGRSTVDPGVKAFLAITYDGKDISLIVNGSIEGRLTAPGTINATTDEMDVGSSTGGNPFSGQLQGFCVFNRALSLGELRKLLRAGDSAHIIEQSAGTFFDLTSDSAPVVAASAQTRFCGYCGGLMRTNERVVVTTNDSWHSSCYAASLRPPTLLSSGSTSADFGTQSIHLIREFINAVGRRSAPSEAYYFDGTRFVGTSLPVATSYPSLMGVGTAAAILHRYLRGTRSSPWLSLVRLQMAEAIRNQQGTGSYINNGADANGFTHIEVGMMLLLTKNSIEPATWRTWLNSFLAGCYFELNGTPARVTGAVTPGSSDATFYITGNRQLLIALTLYLAFLVTGDGYWQAQYETQLAFVLNPSPTAFGNGVNGRAAGYGLFDGLANTLILEANLLSLSDTTGKAYLAENNPGSTPGLDWDYLQLQVDFATRLWLVSGDPRILKLMNIMRNKLQERLNRSTWVLDATGGTRHSLLTAWTTTVEQILVLKAGRGDITVADLASHWTLASGGLEANYRSQGMTGNIGYYRNIGIEPGGVIMAQSDWPGLPV